MKARQPTVSKRPYRKRPAEVIAAEREKAAQEAEWRAWCVKERERISGQRAAFAANLGPARAALQTVMLDRAWELLDAGQCEAADALLEFVPEAAADALLNEYFGDA